MLRRREISPKTIKDGLGEEQNGFLLIPSLFPQVLGQVSSSESLMPNELHSVSSSIMKDETDSLDFFDSLLIYRF